MSTGPLTFTCTDAELDALWPSALCLSLVTGRAFSVVGLNGGPPPPLKAAQRALGRAAAALCDAPAPEGDRFPADGKARRVQRGAHRLDDGAARNVGALLSCLLPGLCLAGGGTLELHGVTHPPEGPVSQTLTRVWPTVLGAFGVVCEIHLERAGFLPSGQGCLRVQVPALSAAPGPDSVELLQRGTLQAVRVTSMVAGPQTARALAQTRGAERTLREAGIAADSDSLSLPSTSAQGGAVLIVAQFEHTLASFCAASLPGEAPEATGGRAAAALARFLRGPGAVDVGTASLLLLWGGLLAAGYRGASHPGTTRVQTPGRDPGLDALGRALEAFLPVAVTASQDGRYAVSPR